MPVCVERTDGRIQVPTPSEPRLHLRLRRSEQVPDPTPPGHQRAKCGCRDWPQLARRRVVGALAASRPRFRQETQEGVARPQEQNLCWPAPRSAKIQVPTHVLADVELHAARILDPTPPHHRSRRPSAARWSVHPRRLDPRTS